MTTPTQAYPKCTANVTFEGVTYRSPEGLVPTYDRLQGSCKEVFQKMLNQRCTKIDGEISIQFTPEEKEMYELSGDGRRSIQPLMGKKVLYQEERNGTVRRIDCSEHFTASIPNTNLQKAIEYIEAYMENSKLLRFFSSLSSRFQSIADIRVYRLNNKQAK